MDIWNGSVDPSGKGFLPLLTHKYLHVWLIIVYRGVLGDVDSTKVLMTPALYFLGS